MVLPLKISDVIGRLRRRTRKIVKSARMKYSPQQQQQEQKDRKSESEMSSVNATPARAAAIASVASQSTTAARRILRCRRSLSTDMFAWMRVFRLATMLNQVSC